MTSRETTLRKLVEAAQTALDAALVLLDGAEATGCTHPNPVELTTMGDRVRTFVCPDCDARFERPQEESAT